jgi:uncharacterized protein YaaN involved in tellurite resistance
MIKVQAKFDEQLNVMGKAMNSLQKGMTGLNFEKMGENAKKLMKGLTETTVKGGNGIGKMFKGLVDGLSGAKSKRSEEETLIKEMQDLLPAMVDEMLTLVDNLGKTETGLRKVIDEAHELGLARANAVRELNVYLGCKDELIKRYNEEYIPNAQKDFEESQDPEDQIYLQSIVDGRDNLLGRLSRLEVSRAASINAAQQLRQIILTMEDQLKKIFEIQSSGQNEWLAGLAAAGFAGSSLKSARLLEQADNFGDKMLDHTTRMIEQSHEMTQKSRSRGTLDPEKLNDVMERMKRMIDGEVAERQRRLEEYEETARLMRGMAENLLDAAEESNNARLLEGTKDVEKDKGSRKAANDDQQQPAASVDDDGAEKKPAAVEKPARPRRNGRGGPK